MNVTCECREFDLFLSWKPVIGMFDLLHYLVNISGFDIMEVSTTSLAVRVQPTINYSVLVSTVNKCQQRSSDEMTEQSAERIVTSKQYSYLLYI